MKKLKSEKFKRVLLISNVPVTPYSAQGASRGSWFRDWDKNKLAMMSFAPADKKDKFANYLFTIGMTEKVGGGLLKNIIVSVIDIHDENVKPNKTNGIDKKPKTLGFKKKLKIFLGLFTYPKNSNNLKIFLDDFKPEILFASVADCYGCRLVKYLSKKLKIPYIIQQEDNWLVSDINSGLFASLVYNIRKSCLKNTIKKASKRYVICPSMKDYFNEQFSYKFESLFCADDFKRFKEPIKHELNIKTTFAYIGNSQPSRSPEFVKIAEAIKNAKITNPEFLIYSNNAFNEDVEKLKEFGFVKFLDLPHHNDVPKVLSKANVLILAESFEKEIIEYTKLALSSKVQIYMMAKVPILIFASKDTGVCDYALKTGFALLVTSDDMKDLEQAVYKIVNDKKLRERLVNKAFKVAKKNHDADIIRKDLKNVINNICEEYKK